MKKNDLAEVKKTDIKALKTKIEEVKKEIIDLVIEKNTGKLPNVKAIKNKRKNLSQLLTVLRQKETLKELENEKNA